jgi:hypothetical protein
MQRIGISRLGLGLVAICVAGFAAAGTVLRYDGSFNLPSASGWNDYYAFKSVLVPAGNARPGWGGTSVTGLSLVVSYSYNRQVKEFNQFPALSKTAAGLGSAAWLRNTSGGTEYSGPGVRPESVDSAGNFWNGDNSSSSGGSMGLSSDPLPSGQNVLGTNVMGTVSQKETGWYAGATYPNGGVLRKSDGAGNALPLDGTAVGARFLTSCHSYGPVHVAENTRLDSTTMTNRLLFQVEVGSTFDAGRQPVDYVRDTSGHEYYLLWLPGTHSSGYSLYLYDSALTNGTLVSNATYTCDISSPIANGAGWVNAISVVAHVNVDWTSNQIYVLDAGVYGANGQDVRYHVFTLGYVPDVQTVDAYNVVTNTADLVGYLAAGTADVVCYWGKSDGGTTASAWDTNMPLGQCTGPLSITNHVTTLDAGTPYYFRFCTTNQYGVSWATNTASFLTLGVSPSVAVNNGSGPTSVTATNATLRGQLVSGSPSPSVWIFWGTADGGTNKGNWNRPAIAKGQPAIGAFSQPVSNLVANQSYWYRCYASNVNQDAWAPDSTNFTTLSPVISINDAGMREGAAGTTNNLTFTVTLAVTSALPVSVGYATADNTATLANNDYRQTTGTLVIPASNLTGQINVPIVGDNQAESDETFYLNLSSATNATIVRSQGTGTITNDDVNYYVRGDGLGSDANDGQTWGTAWATLQKVLNTISGTGSSASQPWVINLQASSNSQAYHGAEVNRDYGNLYINFEGGWQNVDGTPVQVGRSLVKDTNSVPPTKCGLAMRPTGASFGQSLFLGINRFEITNVVDGIRLYIPGNLSSEQLQLNLQNSTIGARTNGLNVVHANNGSLARLMASNVVIRGGLTGIGDAVLLGGRPDGSLIQSATLYSPTAKGFNGDTRCNNGNWGAGFVMSFRDVTASGCASGGVYLVDNTYAHYNTSVYVYLDRVRAEGNTGYGFYRRHDNGNGSVLCYVLATNCVFSGNTLDGVYLRGEDLYGGSAGYGGAFDVRLVNTTVANNGGAGVRLKSRIPAGSGNVLTVYNSIFSGCGTNGLYLDENFTTSGPTVTEAFNDFYGNGAANILRAGTTSTNYPSLAASDLQLDPLFVNKAPTPYQLSTRSLLLDAGSNAVAPAVDILLVARPDGARVSMGAYEKGVSSSKGTLLNFR